MLLLYLKIYGCLLIVSFSAVERVQKTVLPNFCNPPNLHSALYKTNGELV